MKLKLVNLVPLKEGGAFGMSAKDLAATYSLERLEAMRDEVMRDMENDPSVEPEGGERADYYGGTLNGLDDAIAIKRGDSGTPLTYDQAVGRVSRDQFIKSKKFDRGGNRIDEATEKSWNAVDVSRKAEKEISNKEWNERTSKKLDMLKKLNDAGKFKKDFDDERLQGWVDQNYSWEKLSKQFKLNEIYEQNTRAGEFNVNVPVQNEMESVNIKYGHATGPVDDVTISWGNESHNVEFEAEDVIDDHGNEGKDMTFVAYSQDDKWRFIVDVSVGFNYENSGEIYEVHWDTLEIAVDDSKVRENLDDYSLEPEDMDNPDEDLVIIGSGYLDIKSNFGERPSMTNGEYAALGQKVVDQLHNGDKEAALDYIYSQINEGSCGYGPDGVPGDTPGETKGMPADKRTMTMIREVIRKEIKRLHENK